MALLEQASGEQDDMSVEHGKLLQEWQDKLPKDSQYQPGPMRSLTQCEEVLRLHQSFLHMLYHTAFLILYSPCEVYNSNLSVPAQRCVRLVSDSTTHILEDL